MATHPWAGLGWTWTLKPFENGCSTGTSRLSVVARARSTTFVVILWTAVLVASPLGQPVVQALKTSPGASYKPIVAMPWVAQPIQPAGFAGEMPRMV